MKYWHKVSTEERNNFIASKPTVGVLMETYSQPEWCDYPDALSWTMGCWSLCDPNTPVCKEFCSTCDCAKHYEDKIQKS